MVNPERRSLRRPAREKASQGSTGVHHKTTEERSAGDGRALFSFLGLTSRVNATSYGRGTANFTLTVLVIEGSSVRARMPSKVPAMRSPFFSGSEVTVMPHGSDALTN